MPSTATNLSPSLLKPALVFAAAAVTLTVTSPAPAHEPSPAPRAYAGEPPVRIRGIDGRGLNPTAFADWLSTHRDLPGPHAAILFAFADANGDGHVSAVELRDFLMSRKRA